MKILERGFAMKTTKQYIVSFITYGSGAQQDSVERPHTLKEAKHLASQLRSCGHTQVIIHQN
jgi:hypothetical protein